jgi:hypothetical protein
MIKPILRIGMDEKGAVIVDGLLHDKILCLGVLEIAKTIVMEFKPEEKNIIVPTPDQIIKGDIIDGGKDD